MVPRVWSGASESGATTRVSVTRHRDAGNFFRAARSKKGGCAGFWSRLGGVGRIRNTNRVTNPLAVALGSAGVYAAHSAFHVIAHAHTLIVYLCYESYECYESATTPLCPKKPITKTRKDDKTKTTERAVFPFVFSYFRAFVMEFWGQTTPVATAARSEPLTPNDLWATMFRYLGIDWKNTSFLDHSGRPMPILPYGEAIEELL